MPRVLLYGARHTHISLLLQAGMHPKVMADRAGHSTVTLTLNTYSHVLPEVERQAADRYSALIYKQA